MTKDVLTVCYRVKRYGDPFSNLKRLEGHEVPPTDFIVTVKAEAGSGITGIEAVARTYPDAYSIEAVGIITAEVEAATGAALGHRSEGP